MQMSSKTVENSSSFCAVAENDANDRTLLLVTAQDGLVPLPVVVRRFAGDGKVAFGLEQVVQSGFRKIEPKPRSDLKEDESEDIGGGTPSLRYDGIYYSWQHFKAHTDKELYYLCFIDIFPIVLITYKKVYSCINLIFKKGRAKKKYVCFRFPDPT